MRVAVIGLGGVGGYIAANLTKSTHKIVGFARDEHLLKIKKDGIKIVEDNSSWSVKLDARELNEANGYFDVVLFCVKSYDLQKSYEAISKYVDANTIIVSFSNGVSNGNLLRKLSKSKVLDGCVYILSHIESHGVIRKKGNIFLAVFGGLEYESAILKSIFDDSSLRAKISEDIKIDIWKKYIFISAFATLTSYYDRSIGYLHDKHYDEVKSVLKEISDVASAKGIDIKSEIEKALYTASKVPKDSYTSMHLDFKNDKRVELESLCGYIVKEAKISGVKTPLMSKMYGELLK
ncbi:ketopantoate reductase [Sulfurimonas gotlandica GD1]|jgi:2-dehydropantoate 2-reductase|uniref:2-dehydropantoate 2-reductase n=1 Tax=Sulfurimonas gotlandica (strain DSM 19862 / JCM 16533 / GD1) TaxID=929558 RepID=B6BGG1_SULGG|nr:2-dehydropantoate 2-reductase [Sulfurimonas gotlandica]EDZ63531.1 2-dehydropantoate 2-reductase [Sulfurimonas gotlandica GD1]EHP29589.1 ketopantoate reductase [Sulfurimonas gotlandica GD1]